MGREEYNKCMRPYITGSKPKEQRKLDFCVGAKICAGKAKNREEAERICKEAKRTPKSISDKLVRKRGSGKSCEKEVMELAHCMVDKIDLNLASNINSIETAIINAMMECRCPSRE